MNLEQVKKAVDELIADIYPLIMHQSILEGFSKAPNAEDPAYWENIRLGLEQQQAAAQPAGAVQSYKGVKKEEGDWIAEINAGYAIITGYKGKETELCIPAALNGKPVTGIGRRAFREKRLTAVTIPESVTAIGDSAFEKNELTALTIPGGVTAIGEEAFAQNQIETLDIPPSVTKIGKEAFADNMLTALTLPDSVTAIGSMAFEKNRLTALTIPGGITGIDYAVFAKNHLTALTIPETVTKIGDWAFSDNKLTQLNVPPSLVSVGDKAFYGNKLTVVTIPDTLSHIGKEAFGDASVIKAGGAVAVEGKAEKNFEVTPAADGKSVIITAYKVQRNMTDVAIPPLINGKPVTGIGAKAFCRKSAKNIIIPRGVISIGDEAFYENFTLLNITIPPGVTVIGKKAFAGCRSLVAVAIPDSVTVIGDSAFEGCSSLAALTLGSGITNIGTRVFRRCQLNKGVTIPDSVTAIAEEAFYQSKLTSVSLGKGLASIGREAFMQCKLGSITFSGPVPHIGDEAFARNETPEGDFRVCYTDNAAAIIITGYEGKEKTVTFPSQIRGLPVIRINWSAFTADLTEVTIPDNVYIGGGSISYPLIIRTLTIGANVTIEGNNFDRINCETIKDFSPGPKYTPLARLYSKNGRKTATFTLGPTQWDCR